MAERRIDLNLSKNDDDEEEETFVIHRSGDAETEQFDRTIGLIEDLIMDDEFRSIQQNFLDKYAKEFDLDTDENKFIYTDIHREYLTIIEDFIIKKIKNSEKNFDLDRFMKQLESRQDELEGEIFELLLTFTDFLTFKEWMVDYHRSTACATIDVQTCLQSISLETSRTKTSTPLLDQVRIDDDQTTNNSQSQRFSLDLGISGTKINKPQQGKKK